MISSKQKYILDRITLDLTTQCWNWKLSKNNKGYGLARVDGKLMTAHRLSYVVYVDQIPDGLHVLHTCDNPACCNPIHLFVGTASDNAADRSSKGRSAVVSGSANGRAKLTEKDVIAIRTDSRSNTDVAKHYGVCRTTVARIRAHKLWKE